MSSCHGKEKISYKFLLQPKLIIAGLAAGLTDFWTDYAFVPRENSSSTKGRRPEPSIL